MNALVLWLDINVTLNGDYNRDCKVSELHYLFLYMETEVLHCNRVLQRGRLDIM